MAISMHHLLSIGSTWDFILQEYEIARALAHVRRANSMIFSVIFLMTLCFFGFCRTDGDMTIIAAPTKQSDVLR